MSVNVRQQTLWSFVGEHQAFFPVVPNFSSTVNSITGRTLETALPDLGDITVPPSFTRMMKGYIALSRVKKADDIWLPTPFSPTLFRQNKQPWPTLLLECLRGEVTQEQLKDEARNAARAYKKSELLENAKWHCGNCNEKNDHKALMREIS